MADISGSRGHDAMLKSPRGMLEPGGDVRNLFPADDQARRPASSNFFRTAKRADRAESGNAAISLSRIRWTTTRVVGPQKNEPLGVVRFAFHGTAAVDGGSTWRPGQALS